MINWQEGIQAIQQAESEESFAKIRLIWTGKKGLLTEALQTLKDLPDDQKREQGRYLHGIKEAFSQVLTLKEKEFETKQKAKQNQKEWVDLSLPVEPPVQMQGRIHPISQTIEDVRSFFAQQGFGLERGPHIETIEHNFDALNTPSWHPSRDFSDTFYCGPSTEPLVLRTHTSPVQIRTFRHQSPPFRRLVPGRVYRPDPMDATHLPMFHQIEGFAVEPNVHMGHLKCLLTDFLKQFFPFPIAVRFRPSFFPFTEPSAEVDIQRLDRHGKSQWLEVLGCGMIHPSVLRHGGLDPECHQGFAFGMGVERLTMLRLELTDLRSLMGADTRWFAHYGTPFWNH